MTPVLLGAGADRQTYLQASASFVSLTNTELTALIEGFAHELASFDEFDPSSTAVARNLVAPRLRAALDVAARRVARAGKGVDPTAVRREGWTALATEVRERANIVAIFNAGGYHLRQTGRHEWHGQCFVCGGGVDRLMVRTDGRGRYWCRQCGLSGDAITAARTLHGLSFFEAVRQLAAEIRLPAPVTEIVSAAPRRAGHRLRLREVSRA